MNRWIALLAGAIFLAVYFGCAENSTALALYRLIVEGLSLGLWLAACLGLGVWLMRLFGQAGIVSAMAIGMGAIGLVTLFLGLAGWLNEGTAKALIAVGCGAGLLRIYQKKTAVKELLSHPRLKSEPQWGWLLVVPFLAIAALGAIVPPGLLWGRDEPNGYDVVEYHLQVPREWFELGRIAPLTHNVFSFFPFNVEMHYLLAMHLRGGPWAGMYLAQFMHGAMVALSVAAIYEFVGKKGMLGVLFAATVPWLAMLASIAYNEGGLLLFGTLAIGWTLRAMDGEDRIRKMALAGAMAGLACGVKLTAAPMILVGIPIAHLLATRCFSSALPSPLYSGERARVRGSSLESTSSNVTSNRSTGELFKSTLIFLLTGLLVFCPWLIRNLIWAKNPVFPEAMSFLGRAHFSIEQMKRWQLAYAARQNRFTALWWQIFWDWRFGYALFIAMAICAALQLRKRIEPAVVFLLILFLGWLIFWVGFTHLQGRFFVLAIPLAGLVIARVESRPCRHLLTCALLLQVAFAIIHLSKAISATKMHQWASAGLLGIDNPFYTDELQRAAEAKGDVCLVGEAKAFMYPTAPLHLYYRTVFDVDVRSRDIITAWLDGFPTNPADLVVDAGELQRFHNTYYAIPAPPAPAK